MNGKCSRFRPAIVGVGTKPEVRTVYYDTPSVSPFGLTAPSEREPRVLRTGERRALSKNSEIDIHFHIDISHKVDII